MAGHSLKLSFPSRYSQCIRAEEGYCCIQYQVCSDFPQTVIAGIAYSPGFSLDTSLGAGPMAKQDTECSLDYVIISDSQNMCTQGTNNLATTDRYCGSFLNTQVDAVFDVPICGKSQQLNTLLSQSMSRYMKT